MRRRCTLVGASPSVTGTGTVLSTAALDALFVFRRRCAAISHILLRYSRALRCSDVLLFSLIDLKNKNKNKNLCSPRLWFASFLPRARDARLEGSPRRAPATHAQRASVPLRFTVINLHPRRLPQGLRTMLPSQRRRLPVSTKHLPFRRGDSGILTFPSASPRGPSSLAALTGCIHLFTASFTPPATPTPPRVLTVPSVTPTPRIHSREMQDCHKPSPVSHLSAFGTRSAVFPADAPWVPPVTGIRSLRLLLSSPLFCAPWDRLPLPGCPAVLPVLTAGVSYSCSL